LSGCCLIMGNIDICEVVVVAVVREDHGELTTTMSTMKGKQTRRSVAENGFDRGEDV